MGLWHRAVERAAVAWILVGAPGCGRSGGAATASADLVADVVGVRATGSPGEYTVYVSIASAETGCEQYADWWEVLTPSGELVFRRILDHSHPDEQPFERSGGPVAIAAGDEVVVRAHLHAEQAASGGYGGAWMRGSVDAGFATAAADPGFAPSLATSPPLPESCLF